MARWDREDPTPAEIRDRCKSIQAGWDERTKRKRAAWGYPAEPVEFPTAEELTEN